MRDAEQAACSLTCAAFTTAVAVPSDALAVCLGVAGRPWVVSVIMGVSVMAERSLSSVRAALVGRDVELERAHAALDSVIGGEGRPLLISGEPGIGKTRLAEELAALAVDQGALVAWGRVDDVEGAPPYWQWVQVLEGILERGDPDVLGPLLGRSAGPIAAVVPAVAEFVGEIEMPPVLDPAAGRFRLHAAIVDLLRGIAAHRPLVLVLDDMQWADVSSLELTRFVAARLDSAPVLLVVTYRDVDGGSSPAFDDVLASLARLPGLERIALTGLSEPEVGWFIAQTVGLRPRTAIAATVHARTEGNPFFVGEVARLLQSDGLLGAPSPPGEGTVPVGVRDVVRRRLVRLPEQTNELLVLGAVLGREFDVGVLSATAGLGVAAIVEALEPALAARLVGEVSDAIGRLRFSHALVRDTIYGELSALRRATLHACVGDALEQLSPAGPTRLAELAWHFLHAAPVLGPDRGLRYALEAAEAAKAAVSYERAEDELRRALSLIELLPAGVDRWEQELVVQNRLVALLALTRGITTPEAGRACARARELCEAIGDTDGLFEALTNVAAFHHTRGEFSVAAEFAGQFVAIGEQRSNTMWLAAGHFYLAMARMHMGQLAAAREHFASLREVAADLDLSNEVAARFYGPHPMPGGIANAARAAWAVGEESQALALAEEGVQIATQLGHPPTWAWAWYFATHLQILLGNPATVLAMADRAIAYCDEHGLGVYRCWFRIFRGWARCELGDHEEGFPELTASVAENHAAGARINRSVFLGLLAEAEARLGNSARALELIEEALAIRGEEQLWESDLYRRRGELLAMQGPEHRAAAVDALRTAIAVAERQAAAPLATRAMAALAILEPAEPRAGPGDATSSNLTLREREVLALLGQGLTDKEIAAALVISLATVHSHLDRIRDKTGRRRRPELTRLARDLGLVSG